MFHSYFHGHDSPDESLISEGIIFLRQNPMFAEAILENTNFMLIFSLGCINWKYSLEICISKGEARELFNLFLERVNLILFPC